MVTEDESEINDTIFHFFEQQWNLQDSSASTNLLPMITAQQDQILTREVTGDEIIEVLSQLPQIGTLGQMDSNLSFSKAFGLLLGKMWLLLFRRCSKMLASL